MSKEKRDHGGGIDAARKRFGGERSGWMDLSTGINPVPYPVASVPCDSWTALPDQAASETLTTAARRFWSVPENADILATSGLSCAISLIPMLAQGTAVSIPGPTYNEHAAAFSQHGWNVNTAQTRQAQVVVHPNNPDGRLWDSNALPAPEGHFRFLTHNN